MTLIEEIIDSIQAINNPSARADALAEEIQSTANSIPEEFLADQPMLKMLDQLIFECAECGWWCEQCEANEDPDGSDICDDCSED